MGLVDFMEYVNLVDSLHITPRLMIQRKPFRKNNTYGLTLTIRNAALVYNINPKNLSYLHLLSLVLVSTQSPDHYG